MNNIKNKSTNLPLSIVKSSELQIFSKKINNNVKTIPFNSMDRPIGKPRYFPPSTREWSNSIYSYNTSSNLIKNIPSLGKNLSEFIKSYFSLYYKTLKLKTGPVQSTGKSPMKIATDRSEIDFNGEKINNKPQGLLSVDRIHVGKAELKHTSDKVIITLYVYNQQKINYLNYLNNLLHDIYKYKQGYSYINKWLRVIISNLAGNSSKYPISVKNDGIKNKSIVTYNNMDTVIKDKYNQLFWELKSIAKNLDLNTAKFSYDDNYIKILSNLVSVLYNNKKVEFNIVNLKNLYYNIDIVTQSMAIQLRHRKNTLVKVLKYALALIKIPALNHSIEKYGKVDRSNSLVNNIKALKIDLQSLNKVKPTNMTHTTNTFDTKHQDLLSELLTKTIPSVLNEPAKSTSDHNLQNLDKELLQHTEKENLMLEPVVFSNIKYKMLKGLKFKIKGRLTRRFTAERAVLKVRWVNGIQNMDSSYKGLSTVLLRGHVKSNLDYSSTASKVRNGAFGIKGWTSNR